MNPVVALTVLGRMSNGREVFRAERTTTMTLVRVFCTGISVLGLGLFGLPSFAQPSPGNGAEQAAQDEEALPSASVDNAGPAPAETTSAAGQASAVGPHPPEPTAPSPPPTPPFVPGKPEGGELSPLRRPALSIERETTAWTLERAAGINALVLYSDQWGLIAGGDVRLLGFLTLSVGYQRLPTGQTAMMAGGGIVAFSVNGFDLSFWNVFANLPQKEGKPTMQSSNIRLGIPLYARWLPLRIPGARIVITCDVFDAKTNRPIAHWQRIGAGLELGVL